jgi:hypothetical protein
LRSLVHKFACLQVYTLGIGTESLYMGHRYRKYMHCAQVQTCAVCAAKQRGKSGLARTPGGSKLPPVQGSSQGRLERSTEQEKQRLGTRFSAGIKYGGKLGSKTEEAIYRSPQVWGPRPVQKLHAGAHKSQGIFRYMSTITTDAATAATLSKKSPIFVITDEKVGVTNSCSGSRATTAGAQVSRVLHLKCGYGCLLAGSQETLAQVWQNHAREATRLPPPIRRKNGRRHRGGGGSPAGHTLIVRCSFSMDPSRSSTLRPRSSTLCPRSSTLCPRSSTLRPTSRTVCACKRERGPPFGDAWKQAAARVQDAGAGCGCRMRQR